jgi:hypothetical protein
MQKRRPRDRDTGVAIRGSIGKRGSSERNSDMTGSIQYGFMIPIRYRDEKDIDITMSISFYGDICTKPNGPLPAMP